MQNPALGGGVCTYWSRKEDYYMVFSMLIVCLLILRLRRLKIKIDFRF